MRTQSSGGLPSRLPLDREAMRIVEEAPQLRARPFAGIENGDPALRGVGRMRDEYVDRRIVEVTVMDLVLLRRVAQEPREIAPTDGDVDTEDPVAIKIRFGVPAGIVRHHDCGEWESLIRRLITFRVVIEECVAPSNFRRRSLLARCEHDYTRQATDILDDLRLGHTANLNMSGTARVRHG